MLGAHEVLDNIETLERDHSVFALAAKDNEQTYGMYRIPKLPKDLARSEAVYMLSPEVMTTARELRALLLAFQTVISCLPTGRPRGGEPISAHRRMADAIEAAAGIFWSQINPDRVLESDAIWRQLVTAPATIIMEMGGVDSPDASKRFPWRAFVVELAGSGWMEQDGIPTVYGRRYKMLLNQCQKEYSQRRGGEHSGDYLVFTNGEFDWKPATDGYDYKLSRRSGGAVSSNFPEVELGFYDDSENIYHVGYNAEKYRVKIGPVGMFKQPQEVAMLWCGPNPFGRCSAFLAAGNRTPLNNPIDRNEAWLQDLLTTVEQTNVIESIRATRSRNLAAPHDYVHMDPESASAYISQHGKLPDEVVEWADGKTHMLAGEVKARPIGEDPDLDKEEERLAIRKERLMQGSLASLREADVMKASTAAAWTGNWEIGMQLIGPLIKNLDVVRRQMIEAWEHSVRWTAENYGPKYAETVLTAAGADYVRAGTNAIKDGALAEVNAKSFDFPHSWRVSTRQRTRTQAQHLYELVRTWFEPLANGMPGPGIYDDIMEAIDEPDPTRRMKQIATEGAVAAFVRPMIEMRAQERATRVIELRSGIRLPLAAGAPASTPSPGAAPNPSGGPGNQYTVSPAINPAEGGSGPPAEQ